MLERSIPETPKSSSVEDKTNYKVEYLPNMDVVVNLDYPNTTDTNDILGVLRKIPETNFSSTEISKQIGEDRFFVKLKHLSSDGIDFILGRIKKDPIDSRYVRDFNDRARYGLEGVLSEVVLSKKIKRIITSKEVQDLAEGCGFAGIKFAEPIVAIVHRRNLNVGTQTDNVADKYLVYRNYPFSFSSLPINYQARGFIRSLRRIFIVHDIFPSDLDGRQLMMTEQDGKKYLVLIDTEAYFEDSTVRQAIEEVSLIRQEVSFLGPKPADRHELDVALSLLEEGKYLPEDVGGVLEDARQIRARYDSL